MQQHQLVKRLVIAAAAALVLTPVAQATGLATCDSGPQASWQSQATLEKKLVEQKWQVRRIKVDGGCYEVYAINDKGERVEAYFHPVTLAPVPTWRQGAPASTEPTPKR